jgi:hypothetical protein
VTLVLLPSLAAAQLTYRWTDDTGRVWVSDSVPPGHQKYDREVLNSQGIVVRREKGETTPEEAEAQRILMAAASAERAAREERERQDEVLLKNYATEADIARTRDRRLEAIDANIGNLERTLNDLRAHLAERLTATQNMKPYSKAEDARPVPPRVAEDIANTERAIANYEAALVRERADREKLRQSFENDILRFRELTSRNVPARQNR